MAWKYMTQNFLRTGLQRIYEFDETLAAPGNSDWIFIPKNKGTTNAALIPTAGSGKIQYTHDNVATVKAGGETAFDWDHGVVSVPNDDIFHKITAIRLVNVSGTTQMVGGSSK